MLHFGLVLTTHARFSAVQGDIDFIAVKQEVQKNRSTKTAKQPKTQHKAAVWFFS